MVKMQKKTSKSPLAQFFSTNPVLSTCNIWTGMSLRTLQHCEDINWGSWLQSCSLSLHDESVWSPKPLRARLQCIQNKWERDYLQLWQSSIHHSPLSLINIYLKTLFLSKHKINCSSRLKNKQSLLAFPLPDTLKDWQVVFCQLILK